jgi:hypothetical protein
MIVDKMLCEMRIKDVCFVNCDFALFISIYFIIVLIDMIIDLYDLTRLHKNKNFGGFSDVIGRTRHSNF